MTPRNTDKEEWDVIDGCLPSLWKKGCLTDIEFRKIASIRTLSKRKCAIYDMIMWKSKKETSQLIAVLRNSTRMIRIKANSALQNPNVKRIHNDLAWLWETNTFLDKAVIKNLYAFMRLEDIKNCRLVCSEWNTTAKMVLRKRSQVHFRRKVLEPSTFLPIFKDSLPDSPFVAFKFSSENGPWSVGEIQEFCDKCGKYIKELRLEGLNLTVRLTDSEMYLESYDISPWFANCSAIDVLKIHSHKCTRTTLHISLDKLASIKIVDLRECRIHIDEKNQNTHIAPTSISLTDVNVDVLNLNQTKFVKLCRTGRRKPNYFYGTDVWKKVNVGFDRWTKVNGEVTFLHLDGFNFVKKTPLKIKELVVSGKHVIDLSVLPQTIEKLKLLETNQIICSSGPIELPNIKYLLFDIADNNSILLTHFMDCSNMAELELSGSEGVGKLYLRCIPKSVKKMKLNCVHIKFVDYYTLELETLILDDGKHPSRYDDFLNIITKIQAKNLVVVVTNTTQLPAADIMRLVKNVSNNTRKIIVGASIEVDLLKETYFEGGAFSKCVDRKSNYYMFENQLGKAIPQMEFEIFKTMDEIKLK